MCRFEDMPPLWIDNNDAFARFCQTLGVGDPVALDTEFQWTKTYFPIFALLQMGVSREKCAIVDALAITDWAPLRQLLCDESRRKILFSATNDLPILVRACGGYDLCKPTNLFDVQLSMAFAGKGTPSQSLKAVISTELGIELPKSETRSDWTVRPLRAEQIEYACDDVALLPEIALRHVELMNAKGTLDFFLEDMTHLGDSALYILPPVEDAWKNFGGYWRIRSPQERAIVRSLVVWRERIARENNIARSFIFKDEGLYWILKNHPASIHDLLKMPFARRQIIQHYGNELLNELQCPQDIPEVQSDSRNIRCPAFDKYCDRISGCVKKFAANYGIDHALVAVSRDIGALASHLVQHLPVNGMKLVSGWRKEVTQDVVNDILH